MADAQLTKDSMCKHLKPAPIGIQTVHLTAGPFVCPWCEIERLHTILRGIASCSTCEICRDAALKALGECGRCLGTDAGCTHPHCMSKKTALQAGDGT